MIGRSPRKFRGTIWGDNLPENELPLSAKVVTSRLVKTSWGEIYKIEFTDIQTRAKEGREIKPEYFIVTDERIVLINEEDNEAAVKRLVQRDRLPVFEKGDIYGIRKGTVRHQDGLWETKIESKGDQSVFRSSHSSGHFKTVIWKKNAGLIEYAMGSGARAEGFRLKRVPSKKK